MDSTATPIQVQTLGPPCLPKRAPLESASGTKRTSMPTLNMSALRGKADIASPHLNVCF